MAHHSFKPTAVGILPRGGRYTVNDLGDTPRGYADIVKRELGVSRNGDLCDTRFTQLHELSHIHRTPLSATTIRDRHAVPHILVNAAEDVRINTKLLRAIPDAADGLVADPDKSRKDLAGYASTYGLPKSVRAACAIGVDRSQMRRVDDWIRRRLAKLDGRETLSNFTIPLAKLLRDVIEFEDKGDPVEKPDNDGKSEGDHPEHAGAKPGKDGDDDLGDEPAPGAAEGYTHATDVDVAKCEDTGSDWVIPIVKVGPFTMPAHRKRSHSHVPYDCGVSPKYIARHATGDTRLFARKLSKPGAVSRGTVLIDVSGSMTLSPETVDAIVNDLPQATVAIYSGSGHVGGSVIQIVARNGRKVRPEAYDVRGGNTCDGPALLWLSRQSMPRVFYCDGVYTGTSDRMNPRLTRQAEAMIRAGRIIHLKPARGVPPAVVARWIILSAQQGRAVALDEVRR